MNIPKTIENLEKKKYTVNYFETSTKAIKYLEEQIINKIVGFGDSETLLSMQLYNHLSKHNKVIDSKHCEAGENFWTTAKKCLTTDIFLHQ